MWLVNNVQAKRSSDLCVCVSYGGKLIKRACAGQKRMSEKRVRKKPLDIIWIYKCAFYWAGTTKQLYHSIESNVFAVWTQIHATAHNAIDYLYEIQHNFVVERTDICCLPRANFVYPAFFFVHSEVASMMTTTMMQRMCAHISENGRKKIVVTFLEGNYLHSLWHKGWWTLLCPTHNNRKIHKLRTLHLMCKIINL